MTKVNFLSIYLFSICVHKVLMMLDNNDRNCVVSEVPVCPYNIGITVLHLQEVGVTTKQTKSQQCIISVQSVLQVNLR